MKRVSQFDILFEPIKIGPATSKNRFYQVSHCTGMCWQRPNILAEIPGLSGIPEIDNLESLTLCETPLTISFSIK